MKRNILSILLLLIATCSWAQDKNTSASAEMQRIPIAPIIVEGEVTGVPDGTPVEFEFRLGKYKYFYTANMIDTIRNGKFHIEKKFIYKGIAEGKYDENDDNVDYSLWIGGCGLRIFAYPGTKVKVTGNPDKEHLHWRAESNHPLQKEFNEYTDYIREKLSEINRKIKEAYEEDDIDDELVEILLKEKDSIHVTSMLNFMKDKECNSVFTDELMRISIIAYLLKSEGLCGKIRDFIKEKVPTEYADDGFIIFAKRMLIPSSEHLHEGDKMIDFTLYDRDDKEHKLSEFVGKKIVILQFSTVSCGPCHAVRPTIEEFYTKHKKEVEVITISMDDEKIWRSEEKASWQDWNDHASGSTIGAKFDIPGYPFYVIIRPDGIIGSTFPGNKELLDYFKTF